MYKNHHMKLNESFGGRITCIWEKSTKCVNIRWFISVRDGLPDQAIFLQYCFQCCNTHTHAHAHILICSHVSSEIRVWSPDLNWADLRVSILQVPAALSSSCWSGAAPKLSATRSECKILCPLWFLSKRIHFCFTVDQISKADFHDHLKVFFLLSYCIRFYNRAVYQQSAVCSKVCVLIDICFFICFK